jgi:DNA invertase Pin-like site-specific DNA recombinase
MIKSYSYQRFSSIKQREGDSLTRQTTAAKQFSIQHGLTLTETFKDEGVSSFKGKNFSNESALSAFLKLVESGVIEPGSVLILENMDRLSRQSIIPCMTKFLEIINMGVSIGVISQNKILDTKSITENPMELMLVLVEFARANNESETKSTRIKSKITGKIERVKKGEKVWFGVQKPSWIIGFRDGEFIVDFEKVKLVKDIFARYLAGHSSSRIANDLNKSKTPTLRVFKKTDRKKGIWTNSTVAGLLQNKNCIGWFKINGTETEDYFPAIIDHKVFQLAQQKLAFNVKNRGGSKYGLVRNLFKGLLTCSNPKCGETIETKIGSYKNVKGTVNHYADYICRGVKNKNGCTNVGRASVSNFETRLFQSFLNLNQPTKTPPTNETLNELENRLAKVQLTIGRYVKLLNTDDLADMGELATNLGRLKKEKVQLTKDIETEKLKSEAAIETPKVMTMLRDRFSNKNAKVVDGVNRITAVSKKMVQDEATRIKKHLSDNEERKRLKNMLPSVVSSISITFGDNCQAVCKLVNGETMKLYKIQ